MRRILIGTTCLIGHSALACEELIQSCTFDNGAEEVRVCLDSGDVTYQYGPRGGIPELKLNVPVSVADYKPWPGLGNAIWETMTFHNGTTSYAVTGGFPKLGPDADEPEPAFGVIEIFVNQELAGEKICDVGSVQWGYGGGLFDAKTALGQCWKDAQWVACD